MNRFENRVVILTGANGGFGAAAAKAFAAEGTRLVLSDLAEEPAEALTGLDPDRFVYVSGDVTEPTLHQELVATAKDRFGRLDIAVNNAGIAHPHYRMHEIPADMARKVIDIDLMGVFHALCAQIPALQNEAKAHDGCAIVNIASVAGLGGAPGLGIYAAAKHGVVGMTKTAAAENARRGIRINAVCPAFSRTPMAVDEIARSDLPTAEAETFMTRGVPMARLAEVSEVIAAILFAADPANGFMTGQAIAVDGGIGAI
ncbi:SDR family NAD(P)-dependent oxidoreductase [Notoacmeibacter sp. MSK16QG-6]|uniref:SDR family NAD(P)-dependent oxidoreductase n=1 Tax=Notoacmeibacter sp. MSK16QG-6 TaxID=2957982 RepID=UPI0020A15764|nr:SDR family oxidoreductase [Notoacmeibacter sp. MSK16QG-6]MCP1200338.1 SDR family oxidoreductase [Notoacmeibacter sp. MSK16QG-6]